jgi:hypothetical protein
MTEIWILTWCYFDNSAAGVMELCYEDEATAYHILDTIKASEPAKHFEVKKLGIVKGNLR